MTEGRVSTAPDTDPSAAIADLARPELVEGLSSRRFNPSLLNNPEITETGEIVETDEGPGQLVKIPIIEGISWNMPTALILRNPRQPREYFDEAKMRELEMTIGSSGQEVDIEIIPIRLQATGQVKFFILDGERRFRVMKERLAFENVNAKVKFIPNFWELFAKSFMVNESRAPQNPIERAKVYKYLLDNPRPELNRKLTVQELAEHLGTEPNDIYIHLRLLDLDRELQLLIITDRLPKTSALQLAATARNLGPLLDQARLARSLLQELRGDDAKSRSPRKNRQLSIAEKIKEQLESSGQSEKAGELDAAKAALDITRSTGRAIHGAGQVLKAEPRQMIAALRARATPPEAVADDLRTSIAELTATLKIVEASARAPAMPEIIGKPIFSDFINKNKAKFGNKTRFKMALLLAEHSDTDQQPLTSNEIAETLGIDIMFVGSNLRFFRPELAKIGLELEEHPVRVLNEHDEYQKAKAFRISWKISDKTDKAVLIQAAEARAANEAVEEADRTRQRVLEALGASRRSGKESPVIDEEDVPPIESVDDKPGYLEFIESKQSEINPGRLELIMTLARESDGTGKPLSAAEISERIPGSSSVGIGNNIRFLKKDLPKFGLALQQFTFLRQNEQQENVLVTCYRIVWKELANIHPVEPSKKPPTAKLSQETYGSPEIAGLKALLKSIREELSQRADAAEDARSTAEARATKAEAALSAAKAEATRSAPAADPAEIGTLKRQLEAVQTSRDDLARRLQPTEVALVEIRGELDRTKARLAAAEARLAETQTVTPKPKNKSTASAQAKLIDEQGKRLDELRRTLAAKDTELATAKINLKTKTAEALALKESAMNIIKDNEEKFGEDKLSFEIAKLLAETYDDEEEGMTSEEILDYLKDDFKNLTYQKIGTRIKRIREIIEVLHYTVKTTSKSGTTTFKLEKLTPAFPSTEATAEVEDLKGKLTLANEQALTKSREVDDLTRQLAALKEELAAANELLDAETAKPAPATSSPSSTNHTSHSSTPQAPATKPTPPEQPRALPPTNPDGEIPSLWGKYFETIQPLNAAIIGYLMQCQNGNELPVESVRALKRNLAGVRVAKSIKGAFERFKNRVNTAIGKAIKGKIPSPQLNELLKGID